MTTGLLMIIMVVIALWSQFKVNSTFKKWSRIASKTNMTGYEVARQILNDHDLANVQVERVEGSLSDHYHPTKRVVCLSPDVYNSTSVSAIAVAAHECGHAIQHKEAYGGLMLRHNLVPFLNFTSTLAIPLIFLGSMFSLLGLIKLGIIFFAGTVLFHLVTLPVEFDASRRAKLILEQTGDRADLPGVSKVLSAAAFTYVAGALVSIFQLLHYVSIFLGGRDD